MYSIYYQGEESSCGQNGNLNFAVLHDTNNSMGLCYSVEDELGCKNCPAGEAE